MALLIVFAVVVTCILGWAWVRFVKWILPDKKQTTIEKPAENPYIHSHLIRRANDKAYEDYLKWLDETGGDLPIEKVKSKEELKFERDLNF